MIGAIFAFIMLSLVLPSVMKWAVRILCWQKKKWTRIWDDFSGIVRGKKEGR